MKRAGSPIRGSISEATEGLEASASYQQRSPLHGSSKRHHEVGTNIFPHEEEDEDEIVNGVGSGVDNVSHDSDLYENDNTMLDDQSDSKRKKMSITTTTTTTRTLNNNSSNNDGDIWMEMLRVVKSKNNGDASNGNGSQSKKFGGSDGNNDDSLSSINDRMPPLKTDNMDMSVLSALEKMLTSEVDGLIIPKNQLTQLFWELMKTLRSPERFIDTDKPNYETTIRCYNTLQKTIDEFEKNGCNGLVASSSSSSSSTEEREACTKILIKLHASINAYFKALCVSIDDIAEEKHLRTLLSQPVFAIVDSESNELRYMLKRSINLTMNVNFDMNKSCSRQNPMVKMCGSAVVALKTRNVRDAKFTSYELHKCSNDYLSRVMYELMLEKIPRYKSKLNNTVFFNVCHRAKTPTVYGLDRAKLAKLDSDLKLCHVSFGDGFLQMSRNQDTVILVTTLYVNYFLWDKNNL